MNVWAKIGIEVILIPILSVISNLYWVLWRQPHIFRDALKQKWAIEQLVDNGGSSIRQAILEPEYRAMEATLPKDGRAMEYPIMLSSYCGAAFKTWKKVRLRFLVACWAIVIGSALMSWVCASINLLVFLAFKANRLSPNSGSSMSDVVRTVGIVMVIIQHWRKEDAEGCKKFCTELSPQFSTVFAVVSGMGES
jgi:hypothetical protein